MDIEKRKSLGELIRKKRAQLGLNQSALAQKLDITQGQVGKIERGEVSVTIERLRQICTLLNASLIDFLIESNYDTISEELQTKYRLYSDHLTQHQKKYFENEVVVLRSEIDALKKENTALEDRINALNERLSLKEEFIEAVRNKVILKEAHLVFLEQFKACTIKTIRKYKNNKDLRLQIQNIFDEVMDESTDCFVESVKDNYKELSTELGLLHELQDIILPVPGYDVEIENLVKDFQKEVAAEKRKAAEE